MKVIFEGDPRIVITQMKEFIALCSLALSTDDDPPAHTVRTDVTRVDLPPKIEYDLANDKLREHVAEKPESEQIEPIPGNSPPQKSDVGDCPFCGKSSQGKKLNGEPRKASQAHMKYCKKNPNRIPHPKEGQPTPWLKRRSENTEKVISETSTPATIAAGEDEEPF